MFDITALALKDTFELKLRNPVTGEVLVDADGANASVSLYGTASKQYRSAVTAMQNRKLKRQAKKEKDTVEILKEESVGLLVACTAGMTNISIAGKVPSTEADYHDLYSDPVYSWIKDQVDEALGDVANFLAQ